MTERRVNHEARAAKAWPVLAECAVRRSTTSYAELGELIGGVHQRAIGLTLGPIQEFCLSEKLPPLTILVVQKAAGRPGGGFIAWDVDDIETGLQRVYEFPWKTLPNPFAYALEGDTTIDSLASTLANSPELAPDVYALVRVRGIAQQVFRNTLLAAYDYRCAFCGTTFERALEAAHIVPWSESTKEERLDPRNGLLLCRTHHALFDDGCITIDENLRVIHVDDEYPPETYTTADTWLTQRLHGTTIIVPENKRLRPGIQYLRRRNKW